MLLFILNQNIDTGLKIAMTKDGVKHYVDKLIDYAVFNFQTIDFGKINQSIDLGVTRFVIYLSNIKLITFDAYNYEFTLAPQIFKLHDVNIDVSVEYSFIQQSFPYLDFTGLAKAQIKLQINVEADFYLDKELSLMKFNLKNVYTDISYLFIDFQIQYINSIFNAAKELFTQIIGQVVLPVAYKALVMTINQFFTKFQYIIPHGNCVYNFQFNDFLIDNRQITFSHPAFCNDSLAFNNLPDIYTTDDLNYIFDINVIQSVFGDKALVEIRNGVIVTLNNKKSLCKIEVISILDPKDKSKLRGKVQLKCSNQEIEDIFNSNGPLLYNVWFITFGNIIYQPTYFIVTGKIE